MKFRQATIYGFGSWADQTIDFTEDTFICIYGENETGKTTLKQFLLFMLFGLPPRIRSFYQPKTSGKMGGRLSVEGPTGEMFTIERQDHIQNGEAICYTEAGGEHGEAWLQERLGGMTRKTYQSIFSFSALDLAGIKTMKADDLGEVLLGIGLTGATNLQELEKKLDNQTGDLFKRYGKKPAINKQLAVMDQLFSELKKQEHAEAEYKEKKEAITSLSAEIAHLQAVVKVDRENKISIEQQLQAFPAFKTYHYYDKQLAAYPAEITFPENGLERLQQLKDKLLPLKSEQSVFSGNQEKYKEKLQTLKQQLYPEATYVQAEEILQGKQPQLEDRREMGKVKETISKLQLQIETKLQQMDIGITIDDLPELTFPFHIEKTWNDLKNDQDRLDREREQLQLEKAALQKQQDALQRQKQQMEDEKLTTAQKNALTEDADTYERAHYMKEQQRKTGEQNEKWANVKEMKRKRLLYIFSGSVLAAMILAVIGNMTAIPLLYGASVILLLGGFLQYVFGKQSLTATEEMLSGELQLENIRTVTAEEKERAERLLAKDGELRRSLLEINEQIKSVHIQRIQQDEQMTSFTVKEKRFLDQINTQVSDYPFLKQVKPAYWPELFLVLKYVVQIQREKEAGVETLNHLKDSLSSYESKLEAFWTDIDQEKIHLPAAQQILEIESLLADCRDTASLISQYEKWLEENKEKQSALKQKMLVYEAEITALYTLAGVNDEEAFLRKAKQYEEKEEMYREREQAGYQLKTMLPASAHTDLMKRDVADEYKLQAEGEEQTSKLKELENKIGEQQQQLADIRAEVGQLETSETYSDNMHRFTMEKEQLQQMAEEWAVIKTAKEMLTETKRNYRKKYLSKVINKATDYFTALTNGGYSQIFAPDKEKLFQVEADNGIRYDVKELSQGTVDQLYVSLRLAVSEIMSEEHRLPFIIDDAFVHFDARRTQRLTGILANRAKKQQMIIFTCKKEIVEAAKTAAIIHLVKDKQPAKQTG